MPEHDLHGLPDDTLVGRLNHGDAAGALTEIERRYRDRIHRYVHGLVRDEHLASDLTQETFERVFLHSERYASGTCFRAWLFEIARNQTLSALRAQRRTPKPISSLGPKEADDLLEALVHCTDGHEQEERELMAALRAAVERLPESYRNPFELCVLQGLQYQQASRALGLPVGTVAIRILRARQRLFTELAPLLGRLRRPPACAQGPVGS